MKNITKKLNILIPFIALLLLVVFFSIKQKEIKSTKIEDSPSYDYGISILDGAIQHNNSLLEEVNLKDGYIPIKDIILTKLDFIEKSPDGSYIYVQGCVDEYECLEKFVINTQAKTVEAVQECPKWGCSKVINWSNSYVLFETLVEGQIALTLYDFSSSPVQGSTWWLDNKSIGFDKSCTIPIGKATYGIENGSIFIKANECVSEDDLYSETPKNLLKQLLIPYSRLISFEEFLNN